MITFDEKKRVFKLDTPNTSYVMGVEDTFGYLVHYYYGPKLSGNSIRYLSRMGVLPSESLKDKLGFMDATLFEYPVAGTGDYRSVALEVEFENGSNALEIGYKSHVIYKGKKGIEGLPATFGGDADVESLEIVLEDKIAGIEVTLIYSVFTNIDAITRSAKIKNLKDDAVYITKAMSASLDMENRDYQMMTHVGAWSREHGIQFRDLSFGYQGVTSERGISSAVANPFMAITTKNITQTEGEVYAMNFVYSGNFVADIYVSPNEDARATMGISPYHFRWKLNEGEVFDTPEVVMVYSHEGLGKMTRTFHRLYRNHLIRSPYKNKKRPILINNWEATYFDFNLDKLLDIAKEASKLGIELLVMDDGWFGNRFDDNRALGDWFVNEEKLPGGLKALADGINSYGMKFGIWMEPEMVCPDSELHRAHPDWAIQVPGRVPNNARNQLVLDITREEVWQYVWNSIDKTLGSANIEYLKWDMNRPLADLYSLELPNDRQGEFLHRYMLAVYRLQEKLMESYPELLLENCSSGGGRYDAGTLYYSPQVWASDDTDAIERLKIQEGTAMIYPLSSMGAHVSDCPNHIVGRTTPFETRGNVALAGTFGYELDVTKIPEEDRNMIPKQIEMYHKYNDLVREGEYYRLGSFAQNHIYDAWMVKAADESEILVTYVSVIRRSCYKNRIIRLQGLVPGKRYLDETSGIIYDADALMYGGYVIETKWGEGDYISKLIHFVEVK